MATEIHPQSKESSNPYCYTSNSFKNNHHHHPSNDSNATTFVKLLPTSSHAKKLFEPIDDLIFIHTSTVRQQFQNKSKIFAPAQ